MDMLYFTGALQNIYVWFLLFVFINSCHGYDRILDFDYGDCDSYEFYDLTQYQSYLIKWNGKKLSTYSYCIAAFHGENPYNVATDYRVCFQTTDQYFDSCDIEVKYIQGLLNDYGDTYDCNTKIPDKWCTTYKDYAKIKIVAKENTNSRLRIEVTVTADVSLTHGAAAGIAVACLVFCGIVTTVFIVCICKRYQKSPAAGRVIQTHTDQQGTAYQGQQAVGYPTQQIVMVPAGQGRYRPKEVTVQQNVMMPSNAQPQVPYPSQTTTMSPTTENGSENYQNQQQLNPNTSDNMIPSAPPPAYSSQM